MRLISRLWRYLTRREVYFNNDQFTWSRLEAISCFAFFAIIYVSMENSRIQNNGSRRSVAANIKESKAYIETNSTLIEVRNKLGYTPLMQAAFEGNEETVRLLLKNGADITASASHETALHCAAVRGNVNVANALIDAGCEVNARSSDGRTALDIAQRNRYPLFVNYLRAYGGKSGSELSVSQEK